MIWRSYWSNSSQELAEYNRLPGGQVFDRAYPETQWEFRGRKVIQETFRNARNLQSRQRHKRHAEKAFVTRLLVAG